MNYRMLLSYSNSETAGEARRVESSRSQVKKHPGVPGGDGSSEIQTLLTLALDLK